MFMYVLFSFVSHSNFFFIFVDILLCHYNVYYHTSTIILLCMFTIRVSRDVKVNIRDACMHLEHFYLCNYFLETPNPLLELDHVGVRLRVPI